MRRFLAGVALGAVIAVPTAIGAGALKDATFGTVTVNDIEQPVGGGGNLGVVGFHGNQSLDAAVGINPQDFVQLFYSPGNFVNVGTGTADPTVAPCTPGFPGSLYLRHVDSATGELWFKAGGNCAWVKVA